MPDNIDELVRHFICSLIHVPYHINPFFYCSLFQLGQQDLENEFDMDIGPEISVVYDARPNHYNILVVRIKKLSSFIKFATLATYSLIYNINSTNH
jgi:hypothetical protein